MDLLEQTIFNILKKNGELIDCLSFSKVAAQAAFEIRRNFDLSEKEEKKLLALRCVNMKTLIKLQIFSVNKHGVLIVI